MKILAASKRFGELIIMTVSNLGSRRRLPNRPGNVLILGDQSNISVKWIDNQTLAVYHDSDHTYKKLKRVDSVSILYEKNSILSNMLSDKIAAL